MTGKSERRIRILFLADQLTDSKGGTEQHLSFLLSHLPRDRYEVHFVLVRDTGFYDPALYPVPLTILAVDSLFSSDGLRSAVRQLVDLIRKNQIDVVHTFFPDSELIAMLAARKDRTSVVVATRRNMGFRHTRASLWRTRLTNRFISYFLANCQSIKKHIAQLEWIPECKIDVIPNPVPRKRIEQGLQQSVSKQDFGIKDEEQVVGIVATISPVKDHETFLRAAKMVIARCPRTKFLMVGLKDQETSKRLESLISKIKLSSSVVYAGAFDNPIPLVKLFDVGVLSSKSEGLSNSLIEYAAVGVPMVATDVGGNSEVVVHGHTGFLVPPSSPEPMAEKISELLLNKDLRESFGENAKKLVFEKFEEGSVISAYEKYHRKIINRS